MLLCNVAGLVLYAGSCVVQARLIQLAAASDTDNTGEYAHSGFADFQFIERNAACFAN